MSGHELPRVEERLRLFMESVQEYAIPRGHYAHDVWA